mgnify:CR=1 FL=1
MASLQLEVALDVLVDYWKRLKATEDEWYNMIFGRRWNTIEVLTGGERNPYLLYINDMEIERYYISRD